MAIYADLAKLGRVQLPSGNTYALIDVDGRAMIAPNFSSEASYTVGDHVIYGDNLYRFKANHSGEWNDNHADIVSVDSEIKRIENAIQGGISFIGKTTTSLYDGATTNPITINGASVTVTSGNFFELAISMPIGTATITDQIHPTITREMDSQQLAQRVPSLAIEMILSITAVGVGRKISLTLPL